MKSKLLQQFQSSESNVTTFVATLESNDFQKCLPEGWTISQNLQHILDIERLVFESAQTSNYELEISNKSEQIHHIMLMSERKFKAPIVFQPTKEIISISEFLSSFKSLRTEIYSFIENNSIDVMSEDSHPLFGSLSQHDWFIFLNTHTQRHLKQIQVILETLNTNQNGTNS